uniref:Ig-like domain-containing protein n=1 Tax=Maylandia zebra TaxID=106582 RepID=A0A3P9C3T3_9CICH
GLYYTSQSSPTSTAPTVFPLVPCGTESGDMVTLGCLATGFNPPAVTFSWNKGSTALTDFIQYPAVQKGDVYTGVSQVRVRKQDWNPQQNFQCVVNHAAGNAQADIRPTLNVYAENPTLKVFSSSSDEDGTYTASCFAKEFAPKKHGIKWLKNGADVTSKIDLTETVSDSKNAAGKTLYYATSFLTVNSSDLNDKTTFTCQFTGGEDGSLNKTICFLLKKIYIYIFKCGFVIILLTNCFLLHYSGPDCVTSNEIASKPMIEENGMTYLSKLDITYDEWSRGVKRYCVVHHSDLLTPSREPYEREFGKKNTLKHPERPSVFMLPPLEQTNKAEVTLTCFVKDFLPKEVFVSWLVDDEEADSSSYAFNTTEPIENNGFYSAYGQLFVSLHEWKNNAVYSCVVYHESVVNTTRAIVRSIGYRTFDKNPSWGLCPGTTATAD